jgi:hypothetical protein
MAIYHPFRMDFLHWSAGNMVRRMPDRVDGHEQDHHVECVPPRKLYISYETDGVNSGCIQVQLAVNHGLD